MLVFFIYILYLFSETNSDKVRVVSQLIKPKSENKKMRLFCLLLMGVLASQNSLLGESQLPQVKKPFNLSYNDFDSKVRQQHELIGDVIVRFIIDENGKVIQPEIIDTFNLVLNDVIIDKVKQMKFSPPLQNGRPVRVRYKLPITFK